MWQGLAQGICLLAATLGVYLLALHAGRDADAARTLAVVGLTFGNLMLVAANMALGSGLRALFEPSARAFWVVAAVAASALATAVLVPGPRRLLHFGVPAAEDLVLAFATVALAVGAGITWSGRLRSASASRPAS